MENFGEWWGRLGACPFAIPCTARARKNTMQEFEFIREALDDLAVYVRGKYAQRHAVEITSKSEDNDLLTEVDLAVQDELARRIAAQYPGDFIVGEEAGLSTIPSDSDERIWLIDPIDGTQNFVRGLFPAYGISVALAMGGLPVVGGVAVPGTGELFMAQRGEGAYRNGERLHVSSVDRLSIARAEIDFSCPRHRASTLASFCRLIEAAGQVRCHCAAVIGLCSIATGDMDAYVHVQLNPWDFAAAMVIVEEAGGRVTRLDGSTLSLFKGHGGVLASNGRIHEELRQIIVQG